MRRVYSLTTKQEAVYRKLLYECSHNEQYGQPFLRRAFSQLKPKHVAGLNTMAVDKNWNVYIDFDYIQERGIQWGMFALNHEVWHLLRQHHSRSLTLPEPPSGVNKQLLANVAADLEINDDLGQLIPDDFLLPGREPFQWLRAGGSLESYYEALLGNLDKLPSLQHPQTPSQGGKSGDTSPEAGHDGETPAEPAKQPSEPAKQPSERDSRAEIEVGCGSSAGNPAEFEDIDDGGLSEDQEEQILQEVLDDLKQWTDENKGIGSGLGNLEGKLQGELLKRKNKPNWRQVLKSALSSSFSIAKGKTSYLRSRPRRRQPHPEIIYPALISHKPSIAIAVDVSGSNVGNLRTVVAEISDIMEQMGVRGKDLLVFGVDVETKEVKPVSNPLSIFDGIRYGGGSRMTPGYLKLAELNKDLSILITDGEINDYPRQRPDSTRTTFITLIVQSVSTGTYYYEKALKEIGGWSKVVLLSLE